MCTHFTLHYSCDHTATSRRCPRSTTTHTSDSGGTASSVSECGTKTYLDSYLNEDCMQCKVEVRGLAPGMETGLDVLANRSERINRGVTVAYGSRDAEDGVGVGYVAVGAVQSVGGGGVGHVGRVMDSEGNGQVDQRVAILGQRLEEQVQNENGGSDGHWKQREAQVKQADEDEEDWMWGGLKGFGDAEDNTPGKNNRLKPKGAATGSKGKRRKI